MTLETETKLPNIHELRSIIGPRGYSIQYSRIVTKDEDYFVGLLDNNKKVAINYTPTGAYLNYIETFVKSVRSSLRLRKILEENKIPYEELQSRSEAAKWVKEFLDAGASKLANSIMGESQ